VSSPSPFGQNEWLVEEMYRKFREDPSSVDPSWHEFLVDYSPEPTTEAKTTTGNGQPAQAPAPTAPPEPAPAPAPKAAPSSGVAAPAKAPEPPTPAAKPKAPAAPAKAPEPPTPAAKPKAPAAPAPAQGADVQILRGAAAAVVRNMSASLEVPTATSVRAIPAKLMIDNRIVINNHLKRTRGGKISFTHLIGYALVQAVKKFPNMNRHFAEVDGKPNAVTCWPRPRCATDSRRAPSGCRAVSRFQAPRPGGRSDSCCLRPSGCRGPRTN
jgi:2-oxoglutarate decarboxylase